MILIAVVLPAPFGPTKPQILPASTAKETSSRAVTSPYRLASPSSSSVGASAMVIDERPARRPRESRGEGDPDDRGRPHRTKSHAIGRWWSMVICRNLPHRFSDPSQEAERNVYPGSPAASAETMASVPSNPSRRVAVVTGVSRRAGLGYAIVERLLADGLSVFAHSWTAHDTEQPWGAEEGAPDSVLALLDPGDGHLAHHEANLADPEAPGELIELASHTFGAVRRPGGEPRPQRARRARARDRRRARPGMGDQRPRRGAAHAGVSPLATTMRAPTVASSSSPRVSTSGRCPTSFPYAISKGAVHQMTASLADSLADRAITANAINPGPLDTGWADPELHELIRPAFPAGRWGQPDDIARVVSWLASPESAWITGQVLDIEGGFRRGLPTISN